MIHDLRFTVYKPDQESKEDDLDAGGGDEEGKSEGETETETDRKGKNEGCERKE